MIEPVVPLRLLEHYAFCPRQAAIEFVEGVWFDNAHTVRGVRSHRRVDAAASRTERGRRVLRGIELWSERYGLTGRADAVEVLADGSVEPVEYKYGSRHGRNAEVQFCAQALCLEEMLDVSIGVGHIWYAGPRRRHQVAIDDELRALTLATVAAIRALHSADHLPAAPNDARCHECQFLGYCLPGLVSTPERVRSYLRHEVMTCA